MQQQATPTARRHARALRAGMTDAERVLWRRLRQRQLGARFRRQHPVGPFVVDFACLDPRLVVEVDGSQHLEAAAHDRERTAWLRHQGYHVLRFWANDVIRETDAVAVRIQSVLDERRAAPSSTPAVPPRMKRLRAPRPCT